jgi:FixJ family two-component response regulator
VPKGWPGNSRCFREAALLRGRRNSDRQSEKLRPGAIRAARISAKTGIARPARLLLVTKKTMPNESNASVEKRPRPRVLVVDDQLAMAETVADGLSERGYDAKPIDSSREAARLMGQDELDVLVTDLRMPEFDGMALLEVSKHVDPGRPVIIMTAYSAVDSAIESIRRGAYHYLTKPFKVDELALFVDRALDEARLRRETVSLRRELDHLLRESFAGHPGSRIERVTPSIDFGTAVLPLHELQRMYVAWAYERLGSCKRVTAERLGIDDKTLARWLLREPEEELET